jgi:hypothetical protein
MWRPTTALSGLFNNLPAIPQSAPEAAAMMNGPLTLPLKLRARPNGIFQSFH